MVSLGKKVWHWILRIYDKLSNDVLAVVQTRILISYISAGVVIAAISGYLIYRNTISIAEDIIMAIQKGLESNTTASQAAVANSTVQIINTQIWKAELLVGLFIFIIIVLFAWLLTVVSLAPIKKAMDRQRRFAINVAHELRTPLSAMKTSFEVALMDTDESTAGELSEALKSGIEEIDRMTTVTQYFLDSSAFDGRRTEIGISTINLCAVIQKTLERLHPFIGKREVNVRAVCPLTPIMIRGNAVMLDELLLNLLKNAVAYTPDHGSIVVSAKSERGLPTLSVSDTGIGIPANDIPHIFEPFYRGGNAYSQRSKKRGSGIGLAIVKEMVAFHKGTVLVQSEARQGTTISIRFPAS